MEAENPAAKVEAELAQTPVLLKSMVSDGHSIGIDRAAALEEARRLRRAQAVRSGKRRRVRGIDLSNLGLG